MKYLIFIGLFAAGALAGYLVGVNKNVPPKAAVYVAPEMITEFIYDTIVERETIEVPILIERVDTLEVTFDTLNSEVILDTLTEIIQPRDSSLKEEELTIRRDEMISSRKILINYLETPVEKDSVIKDLLGIKEVKSFDMAVQFWRSPIGFSGYKLSKSTLVLYGLSEQFEYKIYHKDKFYYLSHEEIFYVLQETSEFLPFREVQKISVLND